MGRLLDGEARRSLQAAVEGVEAGSAVELVVVVPAQSGRYLHADLAGAILSGWAGLGFLLLSPWSFSLWAIWVDPLVCGLVGGWLVSRLPPLRRWLTPAAWRGEAVLRCARALFVERRIGETRERSGVLIYISQLERQVVVLADRGVQQAVPNEEWARLQEGLTRAVREDDGVGAARRLVEFGVVARAAMPRRADDVNELCDSVGEA
jgi:putative membrane protein